MGVYIPNMDKPKSCGECDLWSNCFYPKNPYTEQDDYIAPDCPLIDIVTCGECKYWHDHEWSSTCDKHIGNGFPSDYFCADGKRRNE